MQRPTAVSLHYHPGVRPLPTWLRLQSPIVYPPASGMVPPGLLANTRAPFSLCSPVSLRHDPNLKLSAWPGVPHWQAQPMEPVYPDDAPCRRIVGIPTPTKEPTRSSGTAASPALTCSIGRRSRPYVTVGTAHPLLGHCDTFGATARTRARGCSREGARCVGTACTGPCAARGRVMARVNVRDCSPGREAPARRGTSRRKATHASRRDRSATNAGTRWTQETRVRAGAV